MPKYTTATIFTKRGNLIPWLQSQDYAVTERQAQYYAEEREIQLILRTRYERDAYGKSKLMCSIKCPVSPLPVKGEFEAPSYGAVCRFLRENGWQRKQDYHSSMFD